MRGHRLILGWTAWAILHGACECNPSPTPHDGGAAKPDAGDAGTSDAGDAGATHAGDAGPSCPTQPALEMLGADAGGIAVVDDFTCPLLDLERGRLVRRDCRRERDHRGAREH